MESSGKPEVKTFTWVQPKGFKPEIALKAEDGEEVAALRWKGGFVFGKSNTDSWVFAQAGIMRRSIKIRANVTGPVLAIYKSGWGGNGLLKFKSSSAPQFHWKPLNQAEYRWLSATNKPLLGFEALKYSPNYITGQIQAGAAVQALPEYGLLLLLGWYILFQKINELENNYNTGRIYDGTPFTGGPKERP
jgi:hypothetical protein